MALTPEEAHAINRLNDPEPARDPRRGYVPVYQNIAEGEPYLGARVFFSQVEAWTKPLGPYVPNLKIVEVIEVRYDG